MIVTTISANIRYSEDSRKGSWKSVELSAEATVGERDNWKQSQDELYHQLAAQLKALWSGNTNGASANGQGGAETAIARPTKPEPTQRYWAHWCVVHQTVFKSRSKNGTVWFSHRQGSAWCNEAEPAER